MLKELLCNPSDRKGNYNEQGETDIHIRIKQDPLPPGKS